MSLDLVSFAYAATIAVGGIIGYVRAGSSISLAMGLASGILMGFGAYQTSSDPKNVFLSIAVTGVLTAIMGGRYYNSGKFMPAGLVAALSLVMLLRCGFRLVQ